MNYITDMLLKRNIQTRKWTKKMGSGKEGEHKREDTKGGGGYKQKKRRQIFGSTYDFDHDVRMKKRRKEMISKGKK
jgi:hypothetical protein